jgi:type III secretion protein Q
VPIALSELAAIEPGYVVQLATPVAQARLRLVACGQVIGHAEMVAVGDHLGARIIRMVARDESELAS